MKIYKILKGMIVLSLCLGVINIFSPVISSATEKSPEEEITHSLEKGQLVLLCFSPDDNDPFLKTVKSEIKGIEVFFKGAVSVFYMNNKDAKGKKLLENLPLSDKKVVVYTIVPDGRVVSRLEGDQITKKNLLMPFMSSCCPGSKKSCK